MNNVEFFEIKNLFGQYDVTLPLDRDVNIFIGENGMGKTTILNCLYNTLSGKIEQLSDVLFDEIKVILDTGKTFTLSKNDLTAYIRNPIRRSTRLGIELKEYFSEKELHDLRNSYVQYRTNSDLFREYTTRIANLFSMPLRFAERELVSLIQSNNKEGSFKKAKEFKAAMNDMINEDILYFPTYRRIEEDMSKLGIDLEGDRHNDGVKDKLIQFGMKDVDTRINRTLDTIRSLAIDGFAKMTGVLLKQYLDEKTMLRNKDVDETIDEGKLGIALDRVGVQIALNDKNRIKELVHNKKIYLDDKKYLKNLIDNLIDSYQKQNEYDNRVKKFVKICNSYLRNKSYIYDESKIELNIYQNNTNKIINTQNLSSGEKQIVSIFSKIYLEEPTSCIILFDEPELSLSITWQSSFLPHILNSGRCKKMITVTHSPFIFDNELDICARDMSVYLTQSTGVDRR